MKKRTRPDVKLGLVLFVHRAFLAAVGGQDSTGVLHLDWFDSRSFQIQTAPRRVLVFKAQDTVVEDNKERRRPAVGGQDSTGVLHLDWFDSRSFQIQTAPRRVPFVFGAGYGSRTRLHGLGNTTADFALYSLNRKKYSICNGFSVFSKW